MKKCSNCFQQKPLTEFYTKKEKSGKIGRQSRCKACNAEVVRGYKQRLDAKLKGAAVVLFALVASLAHAVGKLPDGTPLGFGAEKLIECAEDQNNSRSFGESFECETALDECSRGVGFWKEDRKLCQAYFTFRGKRQ